MSWLTKYLGITAQHNDFLTDGAKKVKTVSEFLGEVADRIPHLALTAEGLDLGWLSGTVEACLPWVEGVATAAGEAIPPIRAVLSIISLITREPDPRALGLLVCSLAYQAALADTVKEMKADPAMVGRIGHPVRVGEARRAMAAAGPERPEQFDGFQLTSALSHPLIRKADTALRTVAQAAGYPDDLCRALQQGVHRRFVEKFRTTISDGRVKDKFDPLFRFMSIESKEFATYGAIDRHIEYQLWRFNEASALGKHGPMSVPCPLCHIFVPPDCGKLGWEEIRRLPARGTRRGERVTPFDENCGGRHSLLSEVLGFLGDRDFNDAIVIQGVAGAGKSAFTHYLCVTLKQLSLRPIRIRMRDLALDNRTLMEDVAQALLQNSGDDRFDEVRGPRPAVGDVDLSRLLDESVPFGGALVSPYVIIFDGWDEISISASEGFRIRIEKTLAAIRREMLSGRSHRVRVILTGRPSDDVNEAKFLQSKTPILTVRPFTRPQLEGFANTLLNARLAQTHSDDPLPGDLRDRIAALMKQFDSDVAGSGDTGRSILGLPLLALLAIWLVLNDRNPPEDILRERTSLYRRLVDLTCLHGGGVEPLSPATARVTGQELRDLLRRTAAAMTLRGTEHISYEELMLRLEADDLEDAEAIISRAMPDSEFAKLMLSFFFNTGNREQGCEFIHKSFREYLFAEAIVERLKQLTRAGSRHSTRSPYWKEFDNDDPRRNAVARLGPLLGPQWISPDVARHLDWLINWEISRAAAGIPQLEGETHPLTIESWGDVRDLLVGLWDWWAEGVHLRPQPHRRKGQRNFEFNTPYAVELAEKLAPSDLPRDRLPEPVRITTIDSHLGDGIFRLSCIVHFEMNGATGWLANRTRPRELWQGAKRDANRPYQTRIECEGGTFWAFSPSSPDGQNHYFESYMSRINAAGWRPDGPFPAGIPLNGIDMAGVEISGTVLFFIRFRSANLSGSKVGLTNILACSFISCYMENAVFKDAFVGLGTFESTDLTKVDWSDAILKETYICNCDLTGANLDGLTLINTDEHSEGILRELSPDISVVRLRPQTDSQPATLTAPQTSASASP